MYVNSERENCTVGEVECVDAESKVENNENYCCLSLDYRPQFVALNISMETVKSCNCFKVNMSIFIEDILIC